MQIALDVLTVTCPILLAIMGGVVALWPPQDVRIRIAWVAAFSLVGLLSTVTTYREQHSSHEAQKALEEEMVGASDFGYVIGVIENAKDTRAPLPLVFINPNAAPLRDVTVSIYKVTTDASKNDVLSSKPAQIQLGTILSGPHRTDTTVNVGSYQIEIRTRRAWFSERLNVINVNGSVQQNCRIIKPGTDEVLFSSN